MKSKSKILIVIIGIILGAIINWTIPYEEINLLNFGNWIKLSLSTLVVCLLSVIMVKEKPFHISLLIVTGIILAVIFRIIYDLILIDSTSHNLAILEIFFVIIQSLLPALIGSFIGKILIDKNKIL